MVITPGDRVILRKGALRWRNHDLNEKFLQGIALEELFHVGEYTVCSREGEAHRNNRVEGNALEVLDRNGVPWYVPARDVQVVGADESFAPRKSHVWRWAGNTSWRLLPPGDLSVNATWVEFGFDVTRVSIITKPQKKRSFWISQDWDLEKAQQVALHNPYLKPPRLTTPIWERAGMTPATNYNQWASRGEA